jgi:hypothetical protein
MDLIALVATKEDLAKCVPTGEQFDVDFELHNTNSSFANSLMRCLIDELEILSLYAQADDIQTDDEYMIKDDFIKTLSSIPINQDTSEEKYEKHRFTIDIHNTTDSIRQIYSGDIQYSGKSLFSENIPIMRLRPQKYLKVKLFVVKGMNKNDGAAFSTVENVRYDVLTPTSGSSVRTNYTSFKLGYTTYRNSTSDATMYIKRVASDLADRLAKIYDELKTVKGHIHNSSALKIELDNQVYKFSFIGEKITISSVIARTCFELDPTISFVVDSIQHPSVEIGVVSIKHDSPVSLIMSAVEMLIARYKTVRAAF